MEFGATFSWQIKSTPIGMKCQNLRNFFAMLVVAAFAAAAAAVGISLFLLDETQKFLIVVKSLCAVVPLRTDVPHIQYVGNIA